MRLFSDYYYDNNAIKLLVDALEKEKADFSYANTLVKTETKKGKTNADSFGAFNVSLIPIT